MLPSLLASSASALATVVVNLVVAVVLNREGLGEATAIAVVLDMPMLLGARESAVVAAAVAAAKACVGVGAVEASTLVGNGATPRLPVDGAVVDAVTLADDDPAVTIVVVVVVVAVVVVVVVVAVMFTVRVVNCPVVLKGPVPSARVLFAAGTRKSVVVVGVVVVVVVVVTRSHALNKAPHASPSRGHEQVIVGPGSLRFHPLSVQTTLA